MPRSELTQPTKEKILKLRETMTIKEIAQHYGRSDAWAQKLVQSYGLQKRAYWGNTKKEKPSREEIKKYLLNHTLSEAAKHFQLALKTVQKLLVTYNLFEEECKFEFITKEEMESLRKTKTIKEIAEQFGVGIYRIREVLERFGIESEPVIHYVIEDKKQLLDAAEKYNQDEIAEKLGVSKNSIFKAFERFDINYKRKNPSNAALYGDMPTELTELQQTVLDGIMLGDGSIPWLNRPRPVNSLRFSQKEANKEYVEHVAKIFEPFSNSIGLTQGKIKGKIFPGYAFVCSRHPLFRRERERWYVDADQKGSPKIVPKDLVLNWMKVAYWFADDGCNCPNGNNPFITIHSQGFTNDDNERLATMLNVNLGIETTFNKRNTKTNGPRYIIRIKKSSYQKFIDSVSPYLSNISCLGYKINKIIDYKYKKSELVTGTVASSVGVPMNLEQSTKNKKFSLQNMKHEFKVRGWCLTSSHYEGSQIPLDAVCPQGHKVKITWNNLQKGQGCSICANNSPTSFNDVKYKFSKHNLLLLENEYKNSRQKLKFKCQCGYLGEIAFRHFSDKTPCKICRNKSK